MGRTEVINAAIAAGKFPESRRAHYERLYDRDPAGTERHIAKLAAALAPGGAPATATPAPSGPDGYDESWLTPRERAGIQAAREGAQPTIVQEA